MSKTYKGNLSLEWYNKQLAILLRGNDGIALDTDIPAPRINWVNKDEALFYEIDSEEGVGQIPYWVNRGDIRVKEARPLILQKVFKCEFVNKTGALNGMDFELKLFESHNEDDTIENILIKGDNLLSLNTIRKLFSNRPEQEKVKCVYIDPPFNIGGALEFYDDNLEHSEWLTMMRDRLVIIHDLLRPDGFIFLHLDDKESAYCKILLDEIFGRSNYLNEIILTTNKPFGFKGTSSSLFKQGHHIFAYAKNKDLISFEQAFIERDYDTAYNKVFLNMEEPEDKWRWIGINEHVANLNGYPNAREAKKQMGDKLESEIALFALKNAEKVFQAVGVSGGAFLKRKQTIEKSSKINDKIIRHPDDDMDYMFIGGRRVVFYSERLVEINGESIPGELITDTWTDIPFEGLAHEGGVDFPKSKKPEKLIERIFSMTTNEGDLVLDCFGGSGTTFAVAQKMKRKWIGIEIGNHADSHIIPRLKSVIEGKDLSGITKDRKWQGGGSFKYYHLGQSIIILNPDGSGDFNWSLGKKFIEESFLSSYDYLLDKSINLSDGSLFPDETNTPSIGVQTSGTKRRVAVITLNEPKGKRDQLSYDEIFHIYSVIKKKLNPEYINIFTNKGLELAFDSKPDDLEVFKIPHAIFSELEK